ncbi:MAG: serine/threonine protein kinase, partial [Thermoleophilia bacterium]|nr:serine/threonine protein kinase [Thermoleophilia bacterium]
MIGGPPHRDHERDADDALTPDERDELDRICDAFEDRWREGDPFRIEDFEHRLAGPARAALILELIATEAELRGEEGEAPEAAEYAARFPDLAPMILVLFREERARARRGGVPGSTASKPPDGSHSPTQPGAWPAGVTEDDPRVLILGPFLVRDRGADRLGSGGMGVVYRALDLMSRRDVALKVVRGEWASNTTLPDVSTRELQARIRHEAGALARLEHDHIVPLYQVGVQDDCLYFAMKLIDGRNLMEVVRAEGPLDGRRAAYIVRALASAVEYAHERGILHRDLKPRNVMIDRDGRPILIDLGLARALDQSEFLTVPGQFVGTAHYTSPEQADGRPATKASDVHGLGAILYALLVGHAPFRGATFAVALRRAIDEDPDWPRPVLKRV